jgi:hypothetical protein
MTNKKFIFLTTMILAAGFLVAFSVDELEIGESDMNYTIDPQPKCRPLQRSPVLSEQVEVEESRQDE